MELAGLVVLLENPVKFSEGDKAIQVNNVPETIEIKLIFVFELLQIRLCNGLVVKLGSESTVTAFVIESLHPSVE